MTDPTPHPLETILRLCAQAAPQPWYPSAFAREAGVPRDGLDPHLDRLRLGGWIELTEWVPNHGQGYRLTPEGEDLVASARQMARVREGQLPDGPPHPAEREFPDDRPPSTWERGEAARDALLSSDPPVVTLTLIAINVLVFLAGVALAARENVPLNTFVQGSTQDVLHRTGAIQGADLLVRHEWWRLLTCCFVHIGLVHLGVNMYSLYAVGPLLERMWGRGWFLILYLLTGICGSFAMVADNPVGGGAGASGALWGVLASMASWVFLNRNVLPPALISDWKRQLLFVFILNIGITLSIPNISRGAHFGGGLAGLVAAVFVDWIRFGRGPQRAVAILGLAALPVGYDAWMMRSLKHIEDRVFATEERTEVPFFNATYMPGISRQLEASEALYDEVETDLLDRVVPRRDEDQVRRALERLAASRAELAKQRVVLQVAGPFRSPRVKKARDLAVDYFQSLDELLATTEEALRRGEGWTPDDEKRRKHQEAAVKEIDRRWRKLLQGD